MLAADRCDRRRTPGKRAALQRRLLAGNHRRAAAAGAEARSVQRGRARTVVAGRYGGLAALYAGLHWPARFGHVLSQSGSFWWPTVQFVTQFENATNWRKAG
ncbi:alpha/beta hydrolase-fold protein [Serratia ureilytica]